MDALNDAEPLTDKQLRFFREYMVDLNATQAAIRAGYSQATARQIGYQLKNDPRIKKLINKAFDEGGKATADLAQRLRESIAHVAFANQQRLYQPDPKNRALQVPRPLHELSEEDAACVARVVEKVHDGGISFAYATHNVAAAKKMLMRLLGMDRPQEKENPLVGELEQAEGELDSRIAELAAQLAGEVLGGPESEAEGSTPL